LRWSDGKNGETSIRLQCPQSRFKENEWWKWKVYQEARRIWKKKWQADDWKTGNGKNHWSTKEIDAWLNKSFVRRTCLWEGHKRKVALKIWNRMR